MGCPQRHEGDVIGTGRRSVRTKASPVIMVASKVGNGCGNPWGGRIRASPYGPGAQGLVAVICPLEESSVVLVEPRLFLVKITKSVLFPW